MTKAEIAILLDYLTNSEYGVQGLIDGYDWLGTGSDSRWAAHQEREARERLDAMVKLLQPKQKGS